MIEIAPNIYFIPGNNKSRFPYCACLYVVGKDRRVLIDVGMGSSNLKPVEEMGIDLLLLTHCHIDHRLTRQEIPQVPVWSHEIEEPYLRDRNRFLAGTGVGRSGVDLSSLYEASHGLFDMEIEHRLVDDECVDLGELTLQAVLTPGHSPGHLSFYIPEHELLFSGDVDLTPFGPFYGHDFADIDDFILSIQKLKQLKAKTVATGHAGPFNENLSGHFDKYEAIIYERDQVVLKHLDRPRSIEYLLDRGIIYRGFPGDDPFVDLLKWFEMVHIEKHLKRLSGMGRVIQDPSSGLWVRR